MERIWRPDPLLSHVEEHTADLWIVGEGPDASSTISSMVKTLYSVVAEEYLLSEWGVFSFDIRASSPEEALVRTLAEVLYLLDGESRILPEPIVSSVLEGDVHRVSLRGMSYRYRIPDGLRGLEVKAITYHGAVLEPFPTGGPCKGRVLVDI